MHHIVEHFVIRLYAPINATIEDDRATVVINDDDNLSADMVSIFKAVYFKADNKLWIKASSDAVPEGSATVTATIISNGVEAVLGTVGWKADKGAYQQVFKNIAEVPDTITLSSDFGGSATSSVEVR